MRPNCPGGGLLVAIPRVFIYHNPVHHAKPPSAAALGAHPFMKGIPWRCLEAMAPLASWVTFPAEAVLFSEGAPAEAMFLVVRGRVALTALEDGINSEVLDVVEAGEPVGWSWFMEPFVWRFTGRAIEPVEAWRLDGHRLRRLADGDAELAGALSTRLVHVLAGRLSAARMRLAMNRRIAAGRPIRVEVVSNNLTDAAVPPL
jgi:CRP/FNR family transcriptional regulator, cyclic AMP receptor protein